MKHPQRFWNESMESLVPDAFHAVQEQALLKQLDYVWANSAFYQQKFRAAGLERGDVQKLEHLSRLPFTEKTELRDSQLQSPPLGTHVACPMRSVKRIYSTSGTTGRPTYIGLTEHDIEVWAEIACRAFWTCALRPGDIVPLIVSPFVVAASFADPLQRIGTMVPIGVGATDRLIGAFQNIGANVLTATASFPLHFADSLERRGIDPKTLGIRLIMCGGEPGGAIPSVREKVESTFDCILLESAGNGDMCGMVWAECEYKTGMHFIGQGIVHPEMIDPDSNAVLDITEGTTGELVYTSLDRECIPLVRFRTRDHAEVVQTECECGRTGYGIRIIGRTDDMIIVRGVNVYPSAVRETVASLAPRTTAVVEIQLHAPPPKGWEPPIDIKVEHGEQPGDLVSLAQELEHLIREKLIFRANVELVPPGALPKYEYKAKLVRNLYAEATG